MSSDVLGDIYEAALHPAHWGAVLERLVGFFDARAAILRTFDAVPETAGLWFTCGIEQSAIAAYVGKYQPLDVWETNARRLGYLSVQGVLVSDMLLSRTEFLESEFYRDFLLPQDIRDLLAIVIHGGCHPPVPLTVLSIFRGHGQPLFGELELDLARQLLRHLARAVGLNFEIGELRHRAAAYSLAFEQFSPAMLFFDRHGTVINANRQATSLIAQADGISVREGRLAASGAEDDAKLQRLFEGCENADPGNTEVVRINRTSGRLPYVAVRITVQQESRDAPDVRRAHFAILLHDPSVPAELDLDRLGKLYGLTPAERRVVKILVDHGSVKSIVHRTDLNENTLRSQIKSVLKKTGTRAQAELIRLALTVALRSSVSR